ncbi:MAG TPA: hypothetical protein VJK51_00540 [Candidatus Nanoarchaeia archaeon]|nr:hypothetical protein [Candidatus Nanoarchaeia archaeon]
MSVLFETIDKKGRKTKLTKTCWTHIRSEHSNVENTEEIIETLHKPDKVIEDDREDVEYFFKYFKHKTQNSKFLKVVVKYINNEGSILSAHFVRHTT